MSDVKRFPPVGRCIYCGATGCKLTDEHIVPLSLNGTWVLRESSCEACADVTKRFEQKCTGEHGGMFYAIRAKHEFKSHRSGAWKKRPEITTDVRRAGGTRERRKFNRKTFPAVAIAPILPRAGILSGLPPATGGECELKFYHQPGDMEAFHEEYPEAKGPVLMMGNLYMAQFVRMLAKIGYAYAVANLGTEGLHPMLPGIILGTCPYAPHLVGDSWSAGHESHDKVGYGNQLAIADITHETTRTQFTVVFVHIMAKFGLPPYHVVVGEGIVK